MPPFCSIISYALAGRKYFIKFLAGKYFVKQLPKAKEKAPPKRKTSAKAEVFYLLIYYCRKGGKDRNGVSFALGIKAPQSGAALFFLGFVVGLYYFF